MSGIPELIGQLQESVKRAQDARSRTAVAPAPTVLAGGAMSVVIPLPWPKPPLTGNRTRGNPHARAAEVKQALAEARWAIKAARLEPIVGANVTLHFRPKDRRRRDADGMFPTLKACQDALVLEGVLPDDSWVHVPAAACRIHEPDGEPACWLELDVLTTYGDRPA